MRMGCFGACVCVFVLDMEVEVAKQSVSFSFLVLVSLTKTMAKGISRTNYIRGVVNWCDKDAK